MHRPLLWVGILLGIVLGAGIWMVRGSFSGRHSAPVVSRSSTEIRTDWKRDALTVIQAYESDHDATKARDALVRLVVPAEGRDAHLALVLALEKARAANAGAEQDWQAAVAQFRSLP